MSSLARPSQAARARCILPGVRRSYHAALPASPTGTVGPWVNLLRDGSLRVPWQPSCKNPLTPRPARALARRLARNLPRCQGPTHYRQSPQGHCGPVGAVCADYVPKEDPPDLGGLQQGRRRLLEDVAPRLEHIAAVGERERQLDVLLDVTCGPSRASWDRPRRRRRARTDRSSRRRLSAPAGEWRARRCSGPCRRTSHRSTA